MRTIIKLIITYLISFTLIFIPQIKTAHAGMITTDEALKELTTPKHLKDVVNYLDHEEVQKQLTKLGVDPREAQLRLANMSQQEVDQLAKDIESSTAGGEVIGLLTVVLLVVLIIYFAKRI